MNPLDSHSQLGAARHQGKPRPGTCHVPIPMATSLAKRQATRPALVRQPMPQLPCPVYRVYRARRCPMNLQRRS